MHIALDGSDLASEKIDGTTVYVRELLPRLSAVLKRHGHRVTVFSHSPIPAEVFGDDAEINVTRGRRFWTQTVLSRALFRVKPDLLFLPIQTVPLYRPANLKVVATIHDLDFLQFPKMFDWKNLLLLRWFSRVVIRNASRLIAVTQNTKNDVLRYYRRSAEDIFVVYHGFDKKNFRPPISFDEKEAVLRNIRDKYKINGGYILYVGAIQPRKNILRLVEAYEAYRKNGGNAELVLVAGNAWKEKEIIRRIENSPQSGAIHLLRKVPYRDLLGIYWNAAIFVLPSLAEGFGLPILEAMACGTPVIASGRSALKEVAGATALLIDPESTDSLAQGLERLMSDSALREELRAKGLKRALDFSWDKCAEETAAVIEGVEC